MNPENLFSTKIIRKIDKCNLTTSTTATLYDVAVVKADGSETPSVLIENLNKIDFFKQFGVADAGLDANARKKILLQLQEQALNTDTPTETLIEGNPGFYEHNGKPILIHADRVLSGTDDHTKVESASSLHLKREKNIDFAKKINFFFHLYPGVSEILTIDVLGCALKPLLQANRVDCDYSLVLEGASGTGKTKMSRLYTSHVIESNEISFDTSISNANLEKLILSNPTVPLRIEDLHYKNTDYDRKKFKNRLDVVVRSVSEGTNGSRRAASVYITAESLKGEAIFSAMDRLLIIRTRKLVGEDKENLLTRMNNVKSSELAECSCEFAKRVVSDYENAKLNIQKFLASNHLPDWADQDTRGAGHVATILLIENLLRTYFREAISDEDHKTLLEALKNSSEYQARVLKALKDAENGSFYLRKFNDFIQDGLQTAYIKTIVNAEEYVPYDENLAYQDTEKSYYYLKSVTFRKVLQRLFGSSVMMQRIIKELRENDVLVHDSDKNTGKFCGVRHYIIDKKALQCLCDDLKKD